MKKLIEELIQFGLDKNMINRFDTFVVRNELFTLLKVSEPYEGENLDRYDEPSSLLNKILDKAVESGLIDDSLVNRDILDAKIMSKLMPRQGELTRTFYNKVDNESVEAATDYFYDLSKNSNYIRMDRVSKNKYFKVGTEFGDLEITINLSKPEKDPKDIEAAKHAKASNYPKCFLCIENIGYEGRINHPARANHRVIPLSLNNENWYLQYSPYVYYNEHAIVFNEKHIDMKINRDSFVRLLDFVDKFSHYFIGSNADLPLVGGSILSHDHFQGGNHFFPMEMAPSIMEFNNKDFEGIKFSFIKWPLSVIRVEGEDKEKIVNAANYIFENWCDYSDESVSVKSHSELEGELVRHNTVTPIARKKDGKYILSLTLRNNRKSDEYPFGIFHPHEEIHHIKKENIGLIEVMGLAVLPKRLDDNSQFFVDVLCGRVEIESIKDNHHYEWLKELKENNPNIQSDEEALEIARNGIGNVFGEGLKHCGVFKQDEEGKKALVRFMNSIGFELVQE